MEAVHRYIDENSGRFVEELSDLLRIPSVSGDPSFRESVRTAASFVVARLEEAGCQSELVETNGHPIVFARSPRIDGAPTVLVYGHYDVQPAVRSEGWSSDPFEPIVKDGAIYARGATDDKGQFYTHIKSVEAWTQTVGRPPVNLLFVIEGEEECGSDNLEQFLQEHKGELRCDVAVISDTSQYAPEIPAITYGLRGIVACEIRIDGPSHDLHSGVFGGAVANPVNVLCALVGSLHDAHGRVAIEGFYDDVTPLTDEEQGRFAELPFDEVEFLTDLGLKQASGEQGFSSIERRWARPTCDVNGIYGGYTGAGPKTIVPSSATAKITCRLVPRQDPARIAEQLRRHFEKHLPAGVALTFTTQHGAPGIVFDTSSPFMTAAAAAIRYGFGKDPVFIREGGSIPVVESLKRVLGVETLLLGWGQNTDNLHGPDEHFSLVDFQRGIRASAKLWQELAKTR